MPCPAEVSAALPIMSFSDRSLAELAASEVSVGDVISVFVLIVSSHSEVVAFRK